MAFCLLVFCGTAGTVFPQNSQTESRGIVAEEFIKNRPEAASPGGGPVSTEPPASAPKKTAARNVKKPAYKLAGTPRKSSGPPAKSNLEQLGITLWRLRPARQGDSGARMFVMDASGEWVPERIEVDTPIKFGDRVRISIEATRAGYLYVVDRETYADGSKGEAYLIFPTVRTRSGDNQVRPGKLIDIPAQDDDPKYFNATRNRPDQTGELLSILITASPLDLPITDKPLKISDSNIAEWEMAWSEEAERFEMTGGAGQAWTKEEKEAGASKSTRQLTRDEPPPQTIYRIFPRSKTAFLVNVRLSYAK
jgi:hypothetical protein